MIAAGPGIRVGAQIGGASVLDITPTLLHYLKLPVGKDMDGRVLTGVFASERPIAYVASYEGEAGEKDDEKEA